jgi:hypothetical protein
VQVGLRQPGGIGDGVHRRAVEAGAGEHLLAAPRISSRLAAGSGPSRRADLASAMFTAALAPAVTSLRRPPPTPCGYTPRRLDPS